MRKKIPKEKILIVDDEKDTCDMLSDILTDEGYILSQARTGGTALKKIREGKPGLVLLDIRMPVMNGLELLTRIKRMTGKTAVVMITAHADVDTARESMRLGASDYITKPFDIGLIKAVVREVLAIRAPRNALPGRKKNPKKQ